MNPSLKFGLALCLIAVYLLSFDCAPASKDVEYTFSIGNKVSTGDKLQIRCTPEDLCNKIGFKTVVCKGNLTYPINDKTDKDYTCTSDEFKNSQEKLEWTWKVNCEKEDKTDKPGENKSCGVDITVKTPSKSKVGWIIGSVILVIALLLVVVAFLGYRGVGPMSSVFNN